MNCSTIDNSAINDLTENLNALADFRTALYDCFGNGRDALMNVCDALLTETNARSFPELSLSPFFARRWPSLYEAFEDAQVDRKALQKLFCQCRLKIPQIVG